jgi:hypothetical protein
MAAGQARRSTAATKLNLTPLSRSLARQGSVPTAEEPRSPEGLSQVEADCVDKGANNSLPDFSEGIRNRRNCDSRISLQDKVAKTLEGV